MRCVWGETLDQERDAHANEMIVPTSDVLVIIAIVALIVAALVVIICFLARDLSRFAVAILHEDHLHCDGNHRPPPVPPQLRREAVVREVRDLNYSPPHQVMEA